MYIEGEKVLGVGRVDKNHCGMPWVVGTDGMYYGVIQIILDNPYYSILCRDCKKSKFTSYILADALAGKELTPVELQERKHNLAFDYEQKSEKCQRWRINNRARIKKLNTFKLVNETWWERLSQLLFKRYL